MRFRKRVRAMIEVFHRQAEHLRADMQAHADQVVTDKERADLNKELAAIHEALQKIAPLAPLSFGQWFVRVAGVLLFVLVVAAGTAWHYRLVPGGAQLSVSGEEGGIEESTFVPISTTGVREFPLINRVSTGSLIEVKRYSSLAGQTVGIFVDGSSLLLFFTEETSNGTHQLVRQRIGSDGNVIGLPSIFPSDHDVIDASVIPLGTGWLVATNLLTEEGYFILIEKYTEAWEVTEVRTLLRPMEFETFKGFSFANTTSQDRPYVLLTLRDYGESGTITDTRNIILRTFSNVLEMQQETILDQPNMNADSHASYLSQTEVLSGEGFTILTNGGEPFKYDRLQKGDEIMALTYSEEASPIRFFQLTNNGRPHDYWPESALQEDGFILFSYVKQMLAPGADTTGQYIFPVGTGNVLVAAADPITWETIGNILVTDYQPQPVEGGEAKVGATHPAIAKVGKRLYIAFDEQTVDDPYSDTPTRRILLQWVDLNQ